MSDKELKTGYTELKQGGVCLLLGLLAAGIGLYFRLAPLRDFTSEEARSRASMTVVHQIQEDVINKVQRNHPDMSAEQRRTLARQMFQQIIRQDSSRIQAAIQQVAKKMTQASLFEPVPHLLAADSYHYFYLTERILQQGCISPRIQGHKYFHPLMSAPDGYWEPLTWHPYVGFMLYRLWMFIDPHIPLMKAISFTPLVIAGLSIFPFVCLCLWLGCRPLTIFVSSVFFMLAPVFVYRSSFGWYDNDPYNILFPALLLCVYCAGSRSIDNRRMIFLLGCLFASLMSLYALFWQGWCFWFVLCLCLGLTDLLLPYPGRKTQFFNKVILLSLMVCGPFLFLSLLFGPGAFLSLLNEGWQALVAFIHPRITAWPDVYSTVDELQPASLPLIVQVCGGWGFMTVALIGFGAVLSRYIRLGRLRAQKLSGEDLQAGRMLLVLGLACVYLSLGAQRFALFCVLPFSLCFALGMESICLVSDHLVQSFFKNNFAVFMTMRWTRTVVFLFFMILPIQGIRSATDDFRQTLYNDVWDRALKKIKRETGVDSIVHAWWPEGHFIKAIAQRRVTIDGATMHTPQTYWMANVLLAQEERQAAGLLRMLTNGGNRAADVLQAQGLTLLQSVDLIKRLSVMDRASAKLLLKTQQLPMEPIETLLDLLYTEPTEAYCLVYDGYIRNSRNIRYVQSWSFPSLTDQRFPSTSVKTDPATGFPSQTQAGPDSVAGTGGYYGEYILQQQKGSQWLFENGIQVDVVKKDCVIKSGTGQNGIPQSIIYLYGDEVREKTFDAPTLPYTVVFVKRPVPLCALMDPALARSLLVRMYYFEGKGLQFFKPYLAEDDLTFQTRLRVYALDWSAFE
jgi:hypothetical protein